MITASTLGHVRQGDLFVAADAAASMWPVGQPAGARAIRFRCLQCCAEVGPLYYDSVEQALRGIACPACAPPPACR